MFFIWIGALAWAIFGCLIARGAHGVDALSYTISAFAPICFLALGYFSGWGGGRSARASAHPRVDLARGASFGFASMARRAVRLESPRPTR